jgi:hypothetical protein
MCQVGKSTVFNSIASKNLKKLSPKTPPIERKSVSTKSRSDESLRDSEGIELVLGNFSMDELTLEDITFHTYDFPANMIRFPTHQFFFTKFSLYVIVFDARRPADVSTLS